MAVGEAGTEFPMNRVGRARIRMTDVFLGDDAGVSISSTSTHNGYLSLEPAGSYAIQTIKLNLFTTTDEDSCTDRTLTSYLCLEEMELAQHMTALGLPLSFGSSKSRSSGTSRSKRISTKPKSASHEKDSTSIVEGEVDVLCHDAKEHNLGDLHFDESMNISALDSRNESGKKLVLDEVSIANSENHAKFEFSPDTVRVKLNAEALGSFSLHGDSCLKEILKDTCSRAPFCHDGDLLDEHDLDRNSDDSSISFSCMHIKGNTKTLQRCSGSAESPLRPLVDDHDNFIKSDPLVDDHDNFIQSDYEDWKVVLNPLYNRCYFFNVKTMESTWHPPPCLEKYAFSCSNLSRKEAHVGEAQKNAGSEDFFSFTSVVTDSVSENGGDFHFIDEQLVEKSTKMEAEIGFHSCYTTNRNGNFYVQLSLNPSCVTDDMKDDENKCKNLDEQKEKQQDDAEKEQDDVEKQQVDVLGSLYQHDSSMSTINENASAFSFSEAYTSTSGSMDTVHENSAIYKKRRGRKSQSGKMHGRIGCVSSNLAKYWHQRYSLFSKFNDGIKMDEESWYSVTPESIAKHHALQCGTGIIIDCFTGVGGNAIQFAMRGSHVIAIDVDPQKIDNARHNATIYGVNKMIDFVEGDFFKIAHSLKGDVVFLSPPWGGPSYSKIQTYDLRLLKPRDGYYLFKIASSIARKVVMFLPRNINLTQLAELTQSSDHQWGVTIEKNFLHGRLKGITAYFDKIALD